MSVLGPWFITRVLIVVKTYPNPAHQGLEVSCTAGITEDGKWIRLFPIPFRLLESGQQFRKYQWIEVRVAKSSDSRPESYKVDLDSIKVLGDPVPSKNKWASRKNIVYPLKDHCLCCLQKEQRLNGSPTLGFFKPHHIDRLSLTEDSKEWSEADLAKLSQSNFFESSPSKTLEKIPFKFKYHFTCDHESCYGHVLSCFDWEMAEAYRSWKRKYDERWEDAFFEKFKSKMIDQLDTHFFVGTIHNHPNSWIIVGMFYPQKEVKPSGMESLSLVW